MYDELKKATQTLRKANPFLVACPNVWLKKIAWRKKIGAFFDDLESILKTEPNRSDFSDLYENHPEIKMGIRRAILYLKKKKNDSSSSETL